MINKRITMVGAIGGMILGAYAPQLWGDDGLFGLASILLTMMGGFAGIWLAVVIGKRLN